MGGKGSGGHNRLSDEEKKRRGTFRAHLSEEAYDQRAAQTVIAGPWLPSIPEPSFPLDEVGRKTYDELTTMLFEQNKLTLVTKMWAEQAAIGQQEIHRLMKAGKTVRASHLNQVERALRALKIAEDAKPIANPAGTANKFEACGFANRRNATVRLRRA